jgi:AcrR family transcriptional regulator
MTISAASAKGIEGIGRPHDLICLGNDFFPNVVPMPTPARLLRAFADELPGMRPRFSARELAQQDRILAAAQSLFARFGRTNITMGNFALALRMSPATIRRYFCDLDCILAELLLRHLNAIAKAIGEIPHDAPGRRTAARRAYAEATRTPFGAPTEAHLLLVRDRHVLPPDLLETVEKLRDGLGDIVGGPDAITALTLLDISHLPVAQIEAMLAPLEPAAPAEPPARLVLMPPRPPPPSIARPDELPPAEAFIRARAGPVI